MKTIYIVIITLFTISTATAQQDSLDKLFNKYADKDGFSTVLISQDMLTLFMDKESKKDVDKDVKKALDGLKSIRILTVEDGELNKSLNFFKEIEGQFSFEGYTTLMSIKEKDQQLKMMVKKKDGKIVEFLMLGGGEDNMLIHITGNINLSNVSKISKSVGAIQGSTSK
ncbi:DUF4252 domain-containing protein [Ochrovirga pacifica]|uniref:DUF4252 domain-containing protein n=1 Tax=Ochrovirga pacifica TaxID=1042376 RepID=UPI000255A84A|nr:DUF4252 domain-containing protein [Ochrovirga pacifica]